MNTNGLGFMLSKNLLGLIKELVNTHIVASAIIDNIVCLNNLGFAFFDIESTGDITGIGGNKKASTSAHKWARKILQESLYLYGIRKDVTVWNYYGLKDTDIEKFGNSLAGAVKHHQLSVEFINAKNISKLFSMPRLMKSRLGDSCMNDYPEYFGMLKNCPAVSGMVVLNAEGLQVARSLIWYADIGCDEDVVYMDRLYTSSDSLDCYMIRYANKNGWYHRKNYNSFYQPDRWVSPSGAEVRVMASIELACEGYKYYPYLDTFQYGNSDFVSNNTYNSRYMYLNTMGTRDEVFDYKLT